MSSTLPPRNGDAPGDASQVSPSSSLLPDEAALRRIFDAQFGPLHEMASRELGAAATLAPRVVEAAFVRAWEQRDRFQTPTGLDAFLVDDVHHGVARTLARRASAHRLGHHDEGRTPGAHGDGGHGAGAAVSVASPPMAAMPPVDREVVWQHLLHTIHDQGPSHAARTHAVEVSRHDAAQHVAAIGKTGSWWPVIIASAVGLLAIAAGVRWADRASEESGIQRALNAQDTRAASSGRGQMANVTLGEGSIVRLAPETRVIIPKEFGERLRAIRLEGAATIDAKQGLARGLQVHAGNAIITTTGTTFSVRAWPGENVVVSVSSGTVTVTANAVERSVAQGDALLVTADGEMQVPDAETRRVAMAWTDGRIVLPKQPLDQVLVQLRRWYDLDIGLADPSLKSREVSLDVPITSAKEAIATIESQARVKYGYAGRDLVFRDSAAAAAPAPSAAKKR